MRIAIFSDSFYPELGGIQDSIALAAHTLGARGHKVQFHVPQASARDFSIAGIPEREIDLGPDVAIFRYPSFHIPSPTKQSRFVPPTFRRWRALREFAPDVIHTHTFFGLGWEAVRAARKLDVPLVGTNHSAVAAFADYFPFAKQRLAGLTFRAVVGYYNNCDFVSGPSRSVIQDMQDLGLHAPADVVSNPINTEAFHPVTPEEKEALKKKLSFAAATIMYAGRFGIEKNIDVLIRAMAQVRSSLPGAILVLAGHGSDEPRLRNLIRELDLGASVRFSGTLPHARLAETYQASDVFAIASTSETQSMVLLQAMNCGLPAIGADSLSLKEYIPEGAGLRATPGSADDFAAKIVRVLQDPQRYRQMSASALSFAQQFSPDAVVSRWVEIYGRL